MSAETERPENVIEGRNIMDTGLGRSPAPDQRGTRETSGINSGEASSPRNPRPTRQVTMKEFVVHGYSWFISDWTQSEKVASMTLEERGLYRELLDLCYAQGSITTDEATLQKLARCGPKEFKRAWPKVKQCFTLHDDGRLHNARADAQLRSMRQDREKKKRAGRLGNDARWGKSQPEDSGIADASQPHPDGIASHSHSHSPSRSHSHSHSQGGACDDLFTEVFNAYPEHRRDVSYLTQTAWAAIMGPIHPDDRPGLHAKILDGLDRAKASDDWTRDGGRFVPKLQRFLEERQWTRSWPGPAKSAFQILAENTAAKIREMEAQEGL